MSSKILVCAATSVEAKACQKGVSLAGQSARFEILQTGMGIAQARAALAKRLSDSNLPQPIRVISSGFAGSWTRELAVGSWIFGESVELLNGSAKFDLDRPSINAYFSFSLKGSRVITLERASSHGSLSAAVDMESYAWADICQIHSIPFQIIRLISDNPDAPLPDSIGSFASILTTPSIQDKASFLTRGLSQAVREPKNLARFIARGTQLPGLLTAGWKEIASE